MLSRADTHPGPAVGAPSLLAPSRRFDPAEPEWIDRPNIDPALLQEELALMARGNEEFGVNQLLLDHLGHLLGPATSRPVTVLDLCTGSADIPRSMAAWFRARKQPAAITAVDRSPEVVRIAAEECRDWPEIRLERQDALHLPYAPGSFDVVLCSQALHHFDNENAVNILRGIWRLCRVGCLVNDFRRNWSTIWLVEIAVRLFTRSRIVRHDAPQSCRAAFTIREVTAMARRAGITNFNITRHHAGFRMLLEARK